MTKQQAAMADHMLSRIADREAERGRIREYLDQAGVPTFDGAVQYDLATRVWWLCEIAAGALAEYQEQRSIEASNGRE